MSFPHPFVASEFSEAEFAAICTLLRERSDCDPGHYKDACVKRRIAGRLRTLGYAGPQEYLQRLRQDPEEVQHLLAALSIHVSRFFRDPSTFAALQARVLPQLATQARVRSHPLLRCWSAGCASGEEAYSLALLSRTALPDGVTADILATDISPEVLERARHGWFDSFRLGELDASQLQQYFSAEGHGYRLHAEVCAMVRFAVHDLLAPETYPPADLILCRYVLIYLEPAEQEEIIRRFAETLSPGGILVLGRTETLRDTGRHFAAVDQAERIYRRI